jgi:hypothetical protein
MIEIKAAAELDIGEDERERAREAAIREWTTPRILRPVFSTSPGTLNYQATVINDAPQSRRKWTLKRISVGQRLALGTGLAASSGIQFFLYRYNQALGLPTFDLNDIDSVDMLWTATLVSSTAAIPIALSATFGEDQVTIMYQERLLFVAFGFGTANINGISFTGQVQVLDEPNYAETLANLLTA